MTFFDDLLYAITGQDRSIESVVAENLLRVALAEKDLRKERDTKRLIERARSVNKNYKVPLPYKLQYGFKIVEQDGCEVCCFGNPEERRVIVYFHGGAFMYQPTLFHYRYCKTLADEFCAYVVMPIYPKAPDHTYHDTISMVYGLYLKLLENYDHTNIVFAGDSAGGTISLTLAQYILDKGKLLPSRLVCYSPCLDITLANPEMEMYEDLDPMLNISDLQIKLATYVGDNPTDDPLVSPMYCDYKQLPRATIVYGGHEVLIADGHALHEKMVEAGVDMDFWEYPYMNHAFPVFPIPEAKDVLERLKKQLFV